MHAYGHHGRLQLSGNVGGSDTPSATICEMGMERGIRFCVRGMQGNDVMDGSHHGAPDVRAGFYKSNDLTLSTIFWEVNLRPR